MRAIGISMDGDQRDWIPFDQGRTIGQAGSGRGVIVRDEEHPDGARITLERDAAWSSGARIPFVITCGVYGWMGHTRFLGDTEDPRRAYEAMRADLGTLLSWIPNATATDEELDSAMDLVGDAMEAFVERYP